MFEKYTLTNKLPTRKDIFKFHNEVYKEIGTTHETTQKVMKSNNEQIKKILDDTRNNLIAIHDKLKLSAETLKKSLIERNQILADTNKTLSDTNKTEKNKNTIENNNKTIENNNQEIEKNKKKIEEHKQKIEQNNQEIEQNNKYYEGFQEFMKKALLNDDDSTTKQQVVNNNGVLTGVIKNRAKNNLPKTQKQEKKVERPTTAIPIQSVVDNNVPRSQTADSTRKNNRDIVKELQKKRTENETKLSKELAAAAIENTKTMELAKVKQEQQEKTNDQRSKSFQKYHDLVEEPRG
jgi:hypothetical protein